MTLPQPGLIPAVTDGASFDSAAFDSAVVDGVDVDAVAAAVRGCPGVSGLTGGRYGEVVSYLPGRKVEGVAVGDGRVTVQVRARWGVPAGELGALITVLLTPLTGLRPVDVVIGDVDDPPETPETPAAGPTPAAAGLPPV